MEQTSLFSNLDLRHIRQGGLDASPHLEMSASALQAWKQKVFQFQQDVIATPSCKSIQGQLFADTDSYSVNQIDLFNLAQYNIEFWRWPAQEPGLAALYFVIDHELPLLLYVGETCKANTRWKGVHDCKRYVRNYITAHRLHGLSVKVQIGFWCHAPAEMRPRQKMESTLIHQWRSPFNKENWQYWNTPFIWGKAN
jgi:hypothetical protein